MNGRTSTLIHLAYFACFVQGTQFLKTMLLFHAVLCCSLIVIGVASISNTLNPFHSAFIPAHGDKNGLKVLAIVVENRELDTDIGYTEAYNGVAAVLQENYCKKNGYDYVRLVNDRSNLANDVNSKYPNVTKQQFQGGIMATINNPKHGFDVLHTGYLRARSSSWGKLPAMWHTAVTLGHRYDYIWFMDSDATPNPMYKDRSLSDALREWDANTTQSVKWGKTKPSNATFLFMSNFPFRDDLPCAGTIIYKPTKYAQDAIREWWDFDLIYKARDDFMEQDALWYLIESYPEYNFLINPHSTVVLTENQFASAWRGLPDIWFAHIPSSEEHRSAYFRTM